MSVRVRYAPSPTGSPHVGNVRTALFDYLLAKRHGGQFIVRLEDTDRTRFVEGCEEEILESLTYVGITWDEGPDIGGPHGPYRQSERKEAGLYQPIIDQLLAGGHAYWAFDTPEELAEMREFQQINKQPTGYFGGNWRDATPDQVEEARAAGKPGVIRLRMPRDHRFVINDTIRGRVEVDGSTQDDPVLIKNDGMPTYHFAAIADDHLMAITHVIRGEEWISSAPKHIWLYECLGWDQPVWVHVPVINGTDGRKLSKRHGDTRCLDYRAAGYLGETLANFIALIGWSPGDDREIMAPDELAQAFDLKGLQPSPGVFDIEKLKWMNGHGIRAMEPAALAAMVRDYSGCDVNIAYWEERDPAVAEGLRVLHAASTERPELYERAIALEQERVATLAEFGPACQFFFSDTPEFDEKATAKAFGQPHVADLFDRLEAWYAGLDHNPTPEEIEPFVKGLVDELGVEKIGPIVMPIRVAMTGRLAGPGLFDLMAAVGRNSVIDRLVHARAEVIA